MDFTGFLGNDAVKARLSGAFASGRVAHSYLICGPVGSGKHTLTRILCAAMQCEGRGEKIPCGVCSGCRKALEGVHPDIITVDDPEHKSMTVEPIRAARSDMFIRPNEGKRKIYIIPRGQDMNESAQNALLKILEEPPSHVVFLLTCDNRAQLLPTVQSRSVCIPLGGVPEEEALPLLRQRLPDAGEEELKRALIVFGGVIGQVLHGMEEGTFRRVLELAPALAAAVAAPDEIELLRLTAGLDKDKEALDGVLGALRWIFRDALAARCGAASRLSTSPETADKLARALTRAQLMALLETVEGLEQARLRNMNATLFVPLFCARLRAAAGR